MQPATKPTHQQVRTWMQQRQAERKPVPSRDEIRRQLGWVQSANCAR